MLLTALEQLQWSPSGAVITLATFCVALAVAITFHEFSHAFTALLLGDRTAKGLGRVTLNPVAHLDPLGTAMILFAGFGWGKPTPVNPAYMRTEPRTGMAVTSFAGPLSNVIVASICALPLRTGVVSTDFIGFTPFAGSAEDVLGYLLASIVFLNLILAAFNLLPVAPLDGFAIAMGILPRDAAAQFSQLERYGPAILLGAIGLDIFLGLGILSLVMRPIINALALLVLGGQVWQ